MLRFCKRKKGSFQLSSSIQRRSGQCVLASLALSTTRERVEVVGRLRLPMRSRAVFASGPTVPSVRSSPALWSHLVQKRMVVRAACPVTRLIMRRRRVFLQVALKDVFPTLALVKAPITLEHQTLHHLVRQQRSASIAIRAHLTRTHTSSLPSNHTARCGQPRRKAIPMPRLRCMRAALVHSVFSPMAHSWATVVESSTMDAVAIRIMRSRVLVGVRKEACNMCSPRIRGVQVGALVAVSRQPGALSLIGPFLQRSLPRVLTRFLSEMTRHQPSQNHIQVM
jgi:hypothetical protein